MNACDTAFTDNVVHLRYLECIFQNAVQAIIALAGIVVFIMLLIGGFKYITAGADPKAVESAKKTLTYAIGGLVLVAISFLILVFVSEFTGQEAILNFRLFYNNP